MKSWRWFAPPAPVRRGLLTEDWHGIERRQMGAHTVDELFVVEVAEACRDRPRHVPRHLEGAAGVHLRQGSAVRYHCSSAGLAYPAAKRTSSSRQARVTARGP